MTRITQQNLESYLWGAAVLLRGTIDAGDYKQFIFPLLFYKRLCDVFDEETVTALKDSGGDEDFALFPENHRFQVPLDAHWREIRKVSRDVGRGLQQAMRAIETANPDKLFGIFGDAQWTNKDRLSDAMLRDLIEHFSTLELTVANLPEDELGQGYEYLIKKFADDSGHTAAEFYTNRTVVHLMTEMLDVQPGESVYDPTCGSGGMLLSCIAHLRNQKKEWRNVRLYGQELNLMTSSIARMNCFLHGIEDFRIERGDTLAEPKLVEGDRLQRFDVVLANPPYSIKQWNREAFAADPWGRNVFGVPPQGRADYAFQQHILQSLKTKTGRCAVLWPHGVLFRDDEAAVRRKLIEADLIECVVGLGPNLFYNSSMPSCIVICRTQKPKERRGKILFINAVNEVTRERAQSFLTDEHQAYIASAYHAFTNKDGFSKVVTVDEIRGNEHSLRMGFYVPLKTGSAENDPSGDGLSAQISSWVDSQVSVRGALKTILGSDTQSTPQSFEVHPHAAKMLMGNFDRSKWKRVRFGDVVNKISDRVEADKSGLVHYIGGEHFDNGTIRFSRRGVIEGSTIGPAFHMRFKPGHVLYMSRNPHLRKASVVDFEGICANTSYVCEAVSDKLLQELLPFVMQSDAFWNWGSENKRGSTNPYLNWKDIASFEFDLPPLDQQRRFAESLWALDEVLCAWQEAKRSITQLHETRLADAFGESGAKWKTKPLGKIARVERGMFSHRPRNLAEFYGGEFPFVQTGDVHGADRILKQFENRLTELGTTYSKSFPAGTIFVTIAAVIGATAISDREVYVTDSVVGVVPSEEMDTDYLELFLRHKRHYLDTQAATQTAQKNINLQVLRPLAVPCPPRATQKRIAADLLAPFDAAREAQGHIDKTQALLAALTNHFATPAP
jgi:type I restriction enzyme M protein